MIARCDTPGGPADGSCSSSAEVLRSGYSEFGAVGRNLASGIWHLASILEKLRPGRNHNWLQFEKYPKIPVAPTVASIECYA